MACNIKHVVYIRGNSWKHPSGNWCDPTWINYRMPIMIKYTLASLARQTLKDFTAVVLFNDSTMPTILPYLNDVAKVATPVFNWEKWRQEFYEQHKPQYVYETRLDNDDCYAPDAMELVRQTHPKMADVIGFRNGYYYDLIQNRLLHYDFPLPCLPQFLTYIIDGKQWAYNRSQWMNERGGGQHGMAHLFKSKFEIGGRHFLVIDHGTNASQQCARATTKLSPKEAATVKEVYQL